MVFNRFFFGGEGGRGGGGREGGGLPVYYHRDPSRLAGSGIGTKIGRNFITIVNFN